MQTGPMETVIITVVFLVLAVAGMSLRILFVKDGEFRGTCATNNPMLAKKLGPCVACGKKRGEPCLKEGLHHHNVATDAG